MERDRHYTGMDFSRCVNDTDAVDRAWDGSIMKFTSPNHIFFSSSMTLYFYLGLGSLTEQLGDRSIMYHLPNSGLLSNLATALALELDACRSRRDHM